MNKDLMSFMTKIKAGKAVCNKCGEPAALYYKKWWCGVTTDIGNFNLKGVCNNDRRQKDSKKEQ